MLGINKSDLAGGARWMRDHFASWFATSWLYLIMWGVVAVAFTVLLYIDGKFSRSLAPDSVDPMSFQAMGWAYRFFAASFLMAAARCAIKGVKGGWVFTTLGVFASLIVCLHAFGFGFEALSDRREQAMALRDVSGVQEQSITDQRAFLEARKGQIDADLAAAIEPLNAEIFNLDNDGKLNEDLTRQMRDRRTALQDQAAADKRAIDEQIMALVIGGANARAETIETEADAQPWHPLFVGMAQVGYGLNATWEPSDKRIYISAIIFIIFWVLLAESLVIFLPERIYVMHLHDAAAAAPKEKSEPHVRAAETRKRRARQSRKIEEQAQGYLPAFKKALRYAEKTRWPVAGIAENAFPGGNMDYAITVLQKAGLVTEEEVKKVRREDQLPVPADSNRVDVIRPENLNGSTEVDDADDTSRPVTD